MNPSADAPPSIAALPSRFNGILFRSRLEARWAVFFDALGIQWLYEHEGFSLPERVVDDTMGRTRIVPARAYLPDFYLPDLECWVEIKPPLASDATWAAQEVVDSLDSLPGRWAAIYGPPGYRETDSHAVPWHTEVWWLYRGFVQCDCDYLWCICAECEAIGFQHDGRSARNHHNVACSVGRARTAGDFESKSYSDKNYCAAHPLLIAAADRAMSWRFSR